MTEFLQYPGYRCRAAGFGALYTVRLGTWNPAPEAGQAEGRGVQSIRVLKNRVRGSIKNRLKRAVDAMGYEIGKRAEKTEAREFQADFTPEHIAIVKAVQPYTLTSPERIFALIESVRYVQRRGIPGSIVECGVWKGGSMMAAALTLLAQNRADRELYLFDTYEGMTKPTELDIHFTGAAAMDSFTKFQTGEDSSDECAAGLGDVRRAMESTGYDERLIHYVKGKVETTIPGRAPETIAVLRLDTDWYESTRHELAHLFPRLATGGVLIIDDYGDWQGARKAVDEYIEQTAPTLFLSRIDCTGRLAIKH